MELELSEWGDGTIRLSFWDSEHGDDRIFTLGDDGIAYMDIEQADGTEIHQKVDLVMILRKMAIMPEDTNGPNA